MKTCYKCKEIKSLDMFYKNKRNKDGLSSYCSMCVKVGARTWGKEHPAQMQAAIIAASKKPAGRYSKYKASAKNRGIPFNLTLEEFLTFWQGACSYCGDTIATIGIDRVDSSIGYTLENCVPCCTMCNYIKLDHDLEDLNTHLLKMLKHQGIL